MEPSFCATCKHTYNNVLSFNRHIRQYIGVFVKSRALTHLPKPVGDDLRQIGQLIRDARARRGFTQNDLADRLRVSPTTVRAAEQGDPSLKVGILVSLLWVLGISPLGKVLATLPELQHVPRSRQRVRTQTALDDF